MLAATAAIPYGGVLSYGEVAGAAGSPRGSRAAGNALGANPIPIVIPCHRVLRSGGVLGGYGGGPERKRWLLELEGALEGARSPARLCKRAPKVNGRSARCMGMQASATGTGEQPVRVGAAVPRTFIAGDGLRAIAALGVLVLHAAIETMLFKHAPGFATGDEHANQYRAIAGGAAPLLALTRSGIYIFFALSGYLLSRGFLAAYTLGTPRPPIGRYARNRVLRIVPAFWVVMAVYLTWDHAWHAGGAGGLLAAFGFAQNYHYTHAAVIPQAWTLDIEVAFYALIPLVAVIALALRRPGRGSPGRRLALVLGPRRGRLRGKPPSQGPHGAACRQHLQPRGLPVRLPAGRRAGGRRAVRGAVVP